MLDLSSFAGDAPHIFVLRVRRIKGLNDRNIVGDGVGDFSLAPHAPLTNRCNDFERRIERSDIRFKPHLVVTFASRTVCNNVTVIFFGKFDR